MFGSETKKAEGSLQKAQGDAEYKAAQGKEAAEGAMDRLKGTSNTIFKIMI